MEHLREAHVIGPRTLRPEVLNGEWHPAQDPETDICRERRRTVDAEMAVELPLPVEWLLRAPQGIFLRELAKYRRALF
jgi:hypothetical protein